MNFDIQEQVQIAVVDFAHAKVRCHVPDSTRRRAVALRSAARRFRQCIVEQSEPMGAKFKRPTGEPAARGQLGAVNNCAWCLSLPAELGKHLTRLGIDEQSNCLKQFIYSISISDFSLLGS